eukprot:TRINITY_DN99738_c0_g1_i1.p1 TRINITY_DN99738_c0_g1~~TRINITY_DN99738_c0_g1_i1.p1  ORF type:complete len:251 (+),score=51.38 TRINITY_DN99738_c0_g1_i1:56-808(+)
MGARASLQAAAERKDLLSFLPIQVGPQTPYSKNITHWMHIILLLQAACCIGRGVILIDLLGACWMALLCGLGWYAWYHGMDIGNITLWGGACAVNGVFDTIGFLIPALTGIVKIELLSTVIRIGTPCSEILGALFAWHLYRDFKHSQGIKTPFGDSWDPLGKTFDNVDPEKNSYIAKFNKAGSEAQSFVEKKVEAYGGTAQAESSSFAAAIPNPFQTGPAEGAAATGFNPFQTSPRDVPGERKVNHNACC